MKPILISMLLLGACSSTPPQPPATQATGYDKDLFMHNCIAGAKSAAPEILFRDATQYCSCLLDSLLAHFTPDEILAMGGYSTYEKLEEDGSVAICLKLIGDGK